MENIKSFTFFDGYYEAIKDLDDEDKKDILLAITEYVFDGKEPKFKGIKKSLWALIKPSLNISKTRSKSKQNRNKTESKENHCYVTNQNQNEIKTESKQNQCYVTNQNHCSLLEKEIEIEVEKENIDIKDSNSSSCSISIKDNRENEEQQLQKLFINCTSSTNLQSISECISYLDNFPLEVIKIALLKSAEKNRTVGSMQRKYCKLG